MVSIVVITTLGTMKSSQVTGRAFSSADSRDVLSHYSELHSVSTRSTLILCPPLKNNDTDISCYGFAPLPIPFRLRYFSSQYDHPMVRKTCFSDDSSKMKIRFGCESVFQCGKLPARPVVVLTTFLLTFTIVLKASLHVVG